MRTNKREKLTIVLPKETWRAVKKRVPKGKYSEFFALSALRELERRARKKLLDLKGKIDFERGWREIEELERLETK